MASLSARKEKILQAVVEDYINSAEPISSNIIQSKHLPSLSSATIRNELASLEEMGYLTQPHTSAGRIPTATAYKMYVDRLMPRHKLSRAEIRIIKSHFNKQMIEMKDIIKKTAQVISEVTNYTSVAFVNDISEAIVENIKIIRLTSSSALVIVVTNMGVLKDATVKIEGDCPESYFDDVSKFMLAIFKDKKVSEIMKPKKIIKLTMKEYKVFFDTVIKILKSYSDQLAVDDLVLEGTSKILEYPEYSNIAKAKAMLAVLDAKDQLLPVLQNNEDMQLNINIGKDNNAVKDENNLQPLNDCAIVTANYVVNGKNVGKAGVIGPIRMDYPKVISVLDYISKSISQLPAGMEDQKKQKISEEYYIDANSGSDLMQSFIEYEDDDN